jgi:hypothetical protein
MVAYKAVSKLKRTMNKTIQLLMFTALFTLQPFHCAKAQAPIPQPTEPKTKLETFQAKSGGIIVRGFSSVGNIRGRSQKQHDAYTEIECKEFADAISGRKEYGLTVEVACDVGISVTSVSYIDYDEIDSLIKGIEYISNIGTNVTQLSNFQADYKSKSDLTISVFNVSSGEIKACVTSGKIRPRNYYSVKSFIWPRAGIMVWCIPASC